tara:strand:+ start:533 stop:805 length:273 start_codon:yes stop_codon:yes gene_type:complete
MSKEIKHGKEKIIKKKKPLESINGEDMDNPVQRFMRNHNIVQSDVEKTKKLKKSYIYMRENKITAINQSSIWKIFVFWLECKLSGTKTRY